MRALTVERLSCQEQKTIWSARTKKTSVVRNRTVRLERIDLPSKNLSASFHDFSSRYRVLELAGRSIEGLRLD